MDGDEERSGGIAVCGDVTRDAADGAVASGDVAPTPVAGSADAENGEDVTVVEDRVDPVDADDEPEAPEAPAAPEVLDGAAAPGGTSDEPQEGESASDASAEPEAGEPNAAEPAPGNTLDDSVPDDSVPGDSVADERASVEDDVSGAGDAGNGSGPAASGAAARPRRLRPYLRRGAVALLAAGFVALGVGAFAWVTPSPEAADQRFVDEAQSQGHVVAPGEQQSLVVSAARKICERRLTHDTDQERRATALSADEIAAVGTAFRADTRDFTTLALKTYCSS